MLIFSIVMLISLTRLWKKQLVHIVELEFFFKNLSDIPSFFQSFLNALKHYGMPLKGDIFLGTRQLNGISNPEQ